MNFQTPSISDRVSGRAECFQQAIIRGITTLLFLQLKDRYPKVKIGTIRIPHITVADDLAILAENKSDSQVMVWDVEDISNRERYCVHPTKSHIL